MANSILTASFSYLRLLIRVNESVCCLNYLVILHYLLFFLCFFLLSFCYFHSCIFIVLVKSLESAAVENVVNH